MNQNNRWCQQVKSWCSLGLLMVPFVTLQAQDQRKRQVAVVDFDSRGVSEMESNAMADFFRVALVESQAFRVLERANMEKLFAEIQFQQSGCTTTECAVQIGKMLNVEQIFTGSVTLLEGIYYINIKQINVETSEVENVKSAEADSVRALKAQTEKIADNFAQAVENPLMEEDQGRKKKQRRARSSSQGEKVHRGFFAGLAVLGGDASFSEDFDGERIDNESTTMMNLELGWGFSERWAIVANFDNYEHRSATESVRASSGMGGIGVRFWPTKAWFVQATIGGGNDQIYEAGVTYDVRGTAYLFKTGYEFRIGQRWFLAPEIIYQTMTSTEIDTGSRSSTPSQTQSHPINAPTSFAGAGLRIAWY